MIMGKHCKWSCPQIHHFGSARTGARNLVIMTQVAGSCPQTYHFGSAGVKKYRVPNLVRHAPLLFEKRSRFTPCMSVEGGLSVMGDCQCSYNGTGARNLVIMTRDAGSCPQTHHIGSAGTDGACNVVIKARVVGSCVKY